MKQGRELLRRFGSTGRGRGQEMTKVEEQTEGVEFRKVTTRFAPVFYKVGGIGEWSQKRPQSSGGIVVEAEISRGKLLLENGHVREEGEGCAFDAIGGTEANFGFAFEECGGDVSANIFGKGEGAVVKIEVEIGAVDRSIADAVNAMRIDSYGTNTRVQSCGGRWTIGVGIGLGERGRGCQAHGASYRSRVVS